MCLWRLLFLSAFFKSFWPNCGVTRAKFGIIRKNESLGVKGQTHQSFGPSNLCIKGQIHQVSGQEMNSVVKGQRSTSGPQRELQLQGGPISHVAVESRIPHTTGEWINRGQVSWDICWVHKWGNLWNKRSHGVQGRAFVVARKRMNSINSSSKFPGKIPLFDRFQNASWREKYMDRWQSIDITISSYSHEPKQWTKSWLYDQRQGQPPKSTTGELERDPCLVIFLC